MPMLMLTTITTRRRLGVRLRLRLGLTFTMEAIAAIARKAGTRKAAQCVCAMGKHIAWTLLALVLIYIGRNEKKKWFTNLQLCKTIARETRLAPLTLIDAIAAAKAIVTMANAIQANTICALCAILITVICKQF